MRVLLSPGDAEDRKVRDGNYVTCRTYLRLAKSAWSRLPQDLEVEAPSPDVFNFGGDLKARRCQESEAKAQERFELRLSLERCLLTTARGVYRGQALKPWVSGKRQLAGSDSGLGADSACRTTKATWFRSSCMALTVAPARERS